jgi:hypothetical protein
MCTLNYSLKVYDGDCEEIMMKKRTLKWLWGNIFGGPIITVYVDRKRQ